MVIATRLGASETLSVATSEPRAAARRTAANIAYQPVSTVKFKVVSPLAGTFTSQAR